jgi:hypothetical protein
MSPICQKRVLRSNLRVEGGTNGKKTIDDITKDVNSLKSDLADLVDATGEADDRGHVWLPLPEVVDGYASLQRQRRVSQRLDEETAEQILKDKNLYDRCYEKVPVLNENEVMNCLYEGLLSEEEVDKMFPKSISWALIPVKE